MRKSLAFYGGSFDPVHNAHLSIGRALPKLFELDLFVYIPAFHAPHKTRERPTSAYDRYAMLCIATADDAEIEVSKIEIEMPDRPYSVQTLERLNSEFPDDNIFFVIGADSWRDITAWRDWETVLKAANIIVVTRPGVEMGFDHVTDEIRKRIVDLREGRKFEPSDLRHIYLTDVVDMNIAATDIRRRIRDRDGSWRLDVPPEVAKYIEKYQIYS